MFTVDESVLINKPRSEVFEFMNDPDSVPMYMSNMVEYELVSGEKHEAGRVCHGVVKVAGRRLELNDELVEVEPGSQARLVSEDATVPYRLSIQYEDQGDGTKVSWHQEMDSLKGAFKFADPLVMRLYSRDVHSSLEKAKTILES